jgi:hypothetical protein
MALLRPHELVHSLSASKPIADSRGMNAFSCMGVDFLLGLSATRSLARLQQSRLET